MSVPALLIQFSYPAGGGGSSGECPVYSVVLLQFTDAYSPGTEPHLLQFLPCPYTPPESL